MMEYNEEDYLRLSGLQHFIFCRRQWALIHLENQWADNDRTIGGQILHEKAHNNDVEVKGSKIIARGLRIHSGRLGVSGQCDVVEFIRAGDGIPLPGMDGLYSVLPIEYKHGSPQQNDADRAQLCAQAMCLEEMLSCSIHEGAIFYGETRHRETVPFTPSLRDLVTTSLSEMHELFKRSHTPKSKGGKHCQACSLKELCLPALLRKKSVKAYLEKALCEDC